MTPQLLTPTEMMSRLQGDLQSDQNDAELFQTIVNAPFNELHVETALMFLGIIVLLQVNKQTGTIDRIALSQTELAKRTTDVSAKPFHEIKIGLDETENIIANTIRTGKMHDTTDWNFLFTPVLKPDEARINQANSGIAYSVVYPLRSRDGGALIFSFFQYKNDVGEQQHDFMQAYAELVDESLAN